MRAVTGQHDGADLRRQRFEERDDALHQRVVERIALLGTIEPQDGNRATQLGAKRGWKPDGTQVGTHMRLLKRARGAAPACHSSRCKQILRSGL